MSRSFGRAQVEPTAALGAVLALTLALGVYGAIHASVPLAGSESHPAASAGPAVADALGSGPVDPEALAGAVEDVAPGRSVRATLRTADRTWTVGPPAPHRADRYGTALPVRVGPKRVRPGRLSVAVWS